LRDYSSAALPPLLRGGEEMKNITKVVSRWLESNYGVHLNPMNDWTIDAKAILRVIRAQDRLSKPPSRRRRPAGRKP
jgi:hypothetical protein